MHTQDHITYSIDQTRLRIGAAIGVLVITAGFALGALIHTGSSASSSAPTVEQTESTPVDAGNDDTAVDNTSIPETGEAAVETNSTDTEPATPTEEPETPAEPAEPAGEPAAPAEEPEAPAEQAKAP